ncbi:MAG TPA: rod shape-determining protein MreD [Gammaproteobacteria bacterium]|nr:rod shape-determining protein MreD [Gammaproteobacteria bacterium]
MALARHHGGWVIAFTLIAALMLAVTPLPDWAAPLRPEWPALVLIYWCLALPQRTGVATGWVVGLFLDVLRGALLGQHALAFAIIAYLTIKLHRRIRVFPLWQQSLSVMVFVALQQLLALWIDGMSGAPTRGWSYWLPTLTSAVLWPWLFVLLRALRREFRVT